MIYQLANKYVKQYLLNINDKKDITVYSKLTNFKHTYTIQMSKDYKTLHVHDTAPYLATYIGEYFIKDNYFHVADEYIYRQYSKLVPQAKAINYVLTHLFLLPDWIKIYYDGKCIRCNRQLTDAEQLAKGLGPHCQTMVK